VRVNDAWHGLRHGVLGPLIGVGGAIIFFISLIPIPPFTGTTSHPFGTPFVAILLGPRVA
jgi:ABC-type Co2+ transport system permease subunit